VDPERTVYQYEPEYPRADQYPILSRDPYPRRTRTRGSPASVCGTPG